MLHLPPFHLPFNKSFNVRALPCCSCCAVSVPDNARSLAHGHKKRSAQQKGERSRGRVGLGQKQQHFQHTKSVQVLRTSRGFAGLDCEAPFGRRLYACWTGQPADEGVDWPGSGQPFSRRSHTSFIDQVTENRFLCLSTSTRTTSP
jgi:hypothetical protein